MRPHQAPASLEERGAFAVWACCLVCVLVFVAEPVAVATERAGAQFARGLPVIAGQPKLTWNRPPSVVGYGWLRLEARGGGRRGREGRV